MAIFEMKIGEGGAVSEIDVDPVGLLASTIRESISLPVVDIESHRLKS